MLLKLLYTAVFLFGINDFASSNESADSAECPSPKECPTPKEWASPKECSAHCPKALPCPFSPKGSSAGKPVTPATLQRPAGNKTPEPLLTTARPVTGVPSIVLRTEEGGQIKQEETKRTSADTEDFSPLLISMYI